MEVSLKPYCPLITRSRIAKLAKELRAIIQELDEDVETWRELIQKLNKKWGFRCKITVGVSRYIYVSKKNGIVIKCPYGAEVQDTPRHAIYTKVVPIPYVECRDSEHIFIQPLADVREKSRNAAYDAIAEAVDADEIEECEDDHVHNVAVFNGEAVAIDW